MDKPPEAPTTGDPTTGERRLRAERWAWPEARDRPLQDREHPVTEPETGRPNNP